MIRDKISYNQKGFSMLEILVAVGIVGILAVMFYPNIMNTLETRELENTAREVMMNLQRAKFQAVKTRLNHRVRFSMESYGWAYTIEREDTTAVWNTMSGFVQKVIPQKFNITVNLPSDTIQFSPLGFVTNYSTTQNRITVRSQKLQRFGQPDQRVISVFIGGSVQFSKTQSY
ncbi:MAG: prepilin-type N-terminal cleavage/methylation domain-containing protein [Candidatus Aminicenantes bacterium]|nr:prepilin-type N-terminal cleavage/methylation domain-containing protein [Candidatus Aminicenantes bacterium]